MSSTESKLRRRIRDLHRRAERASKPETYLRLLAEAADREQELAELLGESEVEK